MQPIARGVFNRRAALAWIRQHGDVNAVVYFADDDNAYDVRIFEEVRATRQISVFPVGLVQEYGISSPLVKVSMVRISVFPVGLVQEYGISSPIVKVSMVSSPWA